MGGTTTMTMTTTTVSRSPDSGRGAARRVSSSRHSPTVIAGLAALLSATSAVSAAPAIRTNDSNRVPACATPERLTAFLTDRNPGMDPRFRDIARWYKHYGDAWRVRWDYAFYQMILETNALKYRRGDGRRGDVHERQNNFAGIGATGRGAPGDKFPDIKTGVHAQIQHLVAYSGEMLSDPIAPRTQLVQDSIVEQSRKLRRPVTFGDLARRWAVDRAYARSIDGVAEQFRTAYCNGVSAEAAPPSGPVKSEPLKAVPTPQPAVRRTLSAFAPPSGLGGPKPLKLAGPDTLPWTGSQVQANPTPSNTEREAETAPRAASDASKTETQRPDFQRPDFQRPESQRKVPPVRTIWSRDGVIPPAVSGSQPHPGAAEPVGQPPRTAAAPILERSTDSAVPAPAASEPTETMALPQFKIGPLTAPPSRLGGPADHGAIGAAAPRARFKEVITSPTEDAALTILPAGPCRILAASYGGKKTLLVRAAINGETRYTALTVLDGFEKSMFETYTKASAPGAEVVGEYPDRDQALADARANCPAG